MRMGEMIDRAALRLGATLTSGVAAFSPLKALQMDRARSAYMQMRGYSQAEINRFTSHVQPVQRNADSDQDGQRKRLVGIVRDEIKSNPTAAGLKMTLANNVAGDADVGRGITIDPKIVLASGEPAENDNKTLQGIWALVKDDLDYFGRMGASDLFSSAQNAISESGENLLVLRDTPGRRQRGKRNPFPLSFQQLESDRLPMNGEAFRIGDATDGGSYSYGVEGTYYTPPAAEGQQPQRHVVRHGIEYDEDAMPVAYHLLVDHPGDTSKVITRLRYMRVPVENVIHYFRFDRPEQTRGIGPLISSLDMMRYSHDLIDAELKSCIIQSFFGVNIKGGAIPAFDSNNRLKDAAGVEVAGFKPGMVTVGESAEMYQGNRPGGTFLPFFMALQRQIGAGAGVGYGATSKDYGQGAYSSLRQEENENWRGYQRYQGMHVRHLCKPLWARFVQACVISGRWVPSEGGASAYFQNPERFHACHVQVPGPQHINPLQEVQALAIGLANGIYTLDEVCEASGLDPKERLALNAAYKKFAEENGLVLGWASGLPKPPANFAAAAANAEAVIAASA